MPTQSASPAPAGRSDGATIEAADLAKTYGRGDKAVQALDGIGFVVPAATVFGLLGPNGAGKSTAVRILTTLSKPDSGHARVAGFDVADEPEKVRHVIGYVPQRHSFDPSATGRENLTLQGHIYGMSTADVRSRSQELLDRFGLREAADRIAKTWSGGMQRKLDVALGLIHRPRVLFLDEPTTGLDPEARADMWSEIDGLVETEGLTVLLTTHYLEEADHLADRLIIVDRGRVVAAGTPDELKAGLARDTIVVEVVDPGDIGPARAAVAATTGVGEVSEDGNVVRASAGNGTVALPAVLAALMSAGIELASLTLARPTLDDVYLRHAGRSFQAAATEREVA